MARYVVGRSKQAFDSNGRFSVYERKDLGGIEVFEEQFVVGDSGETDRVAQALNAQEGRDRG